ncbi:MAG: PAS domain-containing protein [Oscillospiraceae bacterium]
MEPLNLTKEQLIEYINTQNKYIQNSNDAKLTGKNADSSLPSFYEELGFLSASSVGLIITDTDGTIISFNKTIQDLLGLHIEERRNLNVADLYADPDVRKKLLNILAVPKTVRDFEVEIKHKDGTLRTVLANIDCIELNDEHVLLTSLYDITQYKQRQKSQKESDKSYRYLFSNVPVGITVTDFQGKLVVSNNAIKYLLGYSTDELRDINIRDFYFIPADRQQLLDLTKNFEMCGTLRQYSDIKTAV